MVWRWTVLPKTSCLGYIRKKHPKWQHWQARHTQDNQQDNMSNNNTRDNAWKQHIMSQQQDNMLNVQTAQSQHGLGAEWWSTRSETRLSQKSQHNTHMSFWAGIADRSVPCYTPYTAYSIPILRHHLSSMQWTVLGTALIEVGMGSSSLQGKFLCHEGWLRSHHREK